ncbi:hypothetical protein SADUNF_Sadunf01G0175500 [Salix dunnii]|uniref:MLO-like protein n=1 Tax=Salix dunnii TaxID=1413687 RepID=A0A835NCG6_9ROSI|nr:hypothetical protein SADUNF_Sadunf01G0175500 [Salix dunnii]
MGEETVLIRQGRSLVETPTYSVATVITVLVFVCFAFQRSICRFGKWLKKTRRKALFVSLEKIKEELMLLGLISLLLAQCARWISEICVNSSLFSSKFYICSEEDYGITQNFLFENSSPFLNETHIPPKRIATQISHRCGEGHEPFVSLEGLEQLHRFLFVLGITHVMYSCLTVGLAMSKIYSWRKWENQINLVADENLQGILTLCKDRQGDEAAIHLCFPPHISSMDQESSAHLDGHDKDAIDILLMILVVWQSNDSKTFVEIGIIALNEDMMSNVHTISKETEHKKTLWMMINFDFSLLLSTIYELYKEIRLLGTTIGFHHYLWSCAYPPFVDFINFVAEVMLHVAIMFSTLQKHKLPTSYNFHKYMVRSMEDEFQGILGISWPLWGYAIICIFINIHGLNIYFWLSFVPAIIVMLVGTKLQHVVSTLALEIGEQTGPSIGNQVEPRDGLFWFGKPEILLRLIQFIIFQNAFEMATFIWSLVVGIQAKIVLHEKPFHDNYPASFWSGLQSFCSFDFERVSSKNRVLVQFWCSYSTVPLNVIITQMGSRFKKALVSESVRDSLHSWCKRVKEKSKRDSAALSIATRSVCSLDTTIDEQDEITVASGSLSRSSSLGSLNEVAVAPPHEQEEAEEDAETLNPHQDHHQLSLRIVEYLNDTTLQPPPFPDEEDDLGAEEEGSRAETLLELFRRD